MGANFKYQIFSSTERPIFNVFRIVSFYTDNFDFIKCEPNYGALHNFENLYFSMSFNVGTTKKEEKQKL